VPDALPSIPEFSTIRDMRQSDAESVSQLTTQLGYSRTPHDVNAWIARLAEQPAGQAAFVACIRDEIVGWIEVSIQRHLQSEPFAMIGGLVVSDRVRGRGIGRLLCHRAEQWTWDHRLDTLRVTSRSTRADAHRFYLRDGYHQVKTSLVFEKSRPA
jgi:GNAT superfamily N-acetyltransferase